MYLQPIVSEYVLQQVVGVIPFLHSHLIKSNLHEYKLVLSPSDPLVAESKILLSISSISSSSFLTGSSNGMATCQGVLAEKSLALLYNLIVYSPSSLPNRRKLLNN